MDLFKDSEKHKHKILTSSYCVLIKAALMNLVSPQYFLNWRSLVQWDYYSTMSAYNQMLFPAPDIHWLFTNPFKVAFWRIVTKICSKQDILQCKKNKKRGMYVDIVQLVRTVNNQSWHIFGLSSRLLADL